MNPSATTKSLTSLPGKDRWAGCRMQCSLDAESMVLPLVLVVRASGDVAFRDGHLRTWAAVVVAVGRLKGGGRKGVALLGVLGLGGAALIPHRAARRDSTLHQNTCNTLSV